MSTEPITFMQFLERMKLYNQGMSFWLQNRDQAGHRQQWLQRQYRRFVDHIISENKERFVLEPFTRPRTRYDRMHYTQWMKVIDRKFPKERRQSA